MRCKRAEERLGGISNCCPAFSLLLWPAFANLAQGLVLFLVSLRNSLNILASGRSLVSRFGGGEWGGVGMEHDGGALAWMHLALCSSPKPHNFFGLTYLFFFTAPQTQSCQLHTFVQRQMPSPTGAPPFPTR